MLITMHFVGLVMLTLFAAGVALAMEWVLLSAAIRSMKPATSKRLVVPGKASVAPGTAQLARAHASQR